MVARPSITMTASIVFLMSAPATTAIFTLSLHDALPISRGQHNVRRLVLFLAAIRFGQHDLAGGNHRAHPKRMARSEEHTSELQSRSDVVCRLLLEKKNITIYSPFAGSGAMLRAYDYLLH